MGILKFFESEGSHAGSQREDIFKEYRVYVGDRVAALGSAITEKGNGGIGQPITKTVSVNDLCLCLFNPV